MRTHVIGERFYIYAAMKIPKARGIARRFARLGASFIRKQFDKLLLCR